MAAIGKARTIEGTNVVGCSCWCRSDGKKHRLGDGERMTSMMR